MATENEDLDIELETDEITVDLTDGNEKDAKEKKPLPRVRLSEPDKEEEGAAAEAGAETNTDVVAEATKALEEAKKRADAAAATANAERQRREAAERQLQQRNKDVDAARAEAESAQLTLLDKGIETAKGEVEAYQEQLTNAYEAGDFKRVAEVQAKMSRAAATLDRLEATKEETATAPKRPEAQQEPVLQTPSLFEQYLSRFEPEAQNWLRAHPECAPPEVGGSQASNAKMMQGHYAALAQSIQPNTPAYFQVIDEHTGYRQPLSAAAAAEPTAAKAAPKAAPSAPPSREVLSARDGRPHSPRSVRLTKDQQDMAKLSFPKLTPQEAYAQYARNLLELEAEGKMGRLTH